MSIFKIIICIILGLVGFCAFLYGQELRDLKSKVTKEEKKALDIIESIAVFLPLIIVAFIAAP